MNSLAYPIGIFEPPAEITAAHRAEWLDDLWQLPARINALTTGLSEQQLTATYRPGSWTVQQLVHHLADSHMNAFLRTKFALTQTHPKILPYPEAV